MNGTQLTQIKSNAGYLEERGNRSTRRKPLGAEKRNQQTQPTYDAGSGNRTRATQVGGECSHHCAIPAPLSMTCLFFVLFCFNFFFFLHFLSFRHIVSFTCCNFTFSVLSKLCKAPNMIAIFLQIVSLSDFAFKIQILMEIPELVFCTVIVQTSPVDIVVT